MIFVGTHEFHLSYAEIMEMRLGEMIDLVNLLSVYNGAAKEKKHYTFDEVLAMR